MSGYTSLASLALVGSLTILTEDNPGALSPNYRRYLPSHHQELFMMPLGLFYKMSIYVAKKPPELYKFCNVIFINEFDPPL